MSLCLCLIFNFLLSIILLLLGIVLSKNKHLDREKMSPFECGFMPKELPRYPLSLRFFLIALIFLVFDVEVVMLFPSISSMVSTSKIPASNLTFIFVVLLLAGLMYEINQGSLDWAN